MFDHFEIAVLMLPIVRLCFCGKTIVFISYTAMTMIESVMNCISCMHFLNALRHQYSTRVSGISCADFIFVIHIQIRALYTETPVI